MKRARRRRPAWIASFSAAGLAVLAVVSVQAPAQASPTLLRDLFTRVTGIQSGPPSLPVSYRWPKGFIPNVIQPDVPPPGAITVDAAGHLARCAHPGRLPVILVHGTWENQHDNWVAGAPLLFNAGFCVYSFNYGGPPGAPFAATRSIPASAAELGIFIDKVRAVTGSNQVDILGHSQGGSMPRYYVKFLPQAWTGRSFGQGVPKIRHLIALSPSNHGTTLDGLVKLGQLTGTIGAVNTFVLPQAAIDQEIGSGVTLKMNTCPGGRPNADVCAGDKVNYTNIETVGDEVITPFRHAFLAANPAAKSRVVNILLQDTCPIDASEHLTTPYDSFAYGFVLKGLGIANPAAVPGASPGCKILLPLVGA
ncbi:MAG TPA: alpha/beta fold hydrolase [Kineosporiaceae bacterium]